MKLKGNKELIPKMMENVERGMTCCFKLTVCENENCPLQDENLKSFGEMGCASSIFVSKQDKLFALEILYQAPFEWEG